MAISTDLISIRELHAFIFYKERDNGSSESSKGLNFSVCVREEDGEEILKWFRQTLTKYGIRCRDLNIRDQRLTPDRAGFDKEKAKETMESVIKAISLSSDIQSFYPSYTD